mgnify:CR=1 FL=1
MIPRFGWLDSRINAIEYRSYTSYNKEDNEYLNAFFMKAITAVTAQELLIHDIWIDLFRQSVIIFITGS